MSQKKTGKWYTFSWINLTQSQRRRAVTLLNNGLAVVGSRNDRESRMIQNLVKGDCEIALTPDARLQIIPIPESPIRLAGVSWLEPSPTTEPLTVSFCRSYVEIFSTRSRNRVWN